MRKSYRDASRSGWTLAGLVDIVLNLGVTPCELSITKLTGKGKGGKGPPYPNLSDTIRQLSANCRLHLARAFCDRSTAPANQPVNQPTSATCDRVLDLLLMKKDVADHLLSEKLDTLTVSLEVKSVLRDTLSTAGAYRLAMGQPHFDAVTGAIVKGRPPEQVDFTWREALGIVGTMFLEFLEAR